MLPDSYTVVTLLHVTADLTFAAGLLASALAVAALSRESTPALVRDRRLIDGLRRWNRVVTGPALVLAWLLGAWLAWRAGWFHAGWLHVKLVLVLAVSGLHGWLSATLRRLAATPPVAPSRVVWAAAPLAVVALAAIVWLALTKTF